MSTTNAARRCAIALLATAAALPGAAAAQDPGFAPTHRVRVTLESCLILRRGPATDADRLDCLARGTELVSMETLEGWMRVRIANGREGWVNRDLVVDRAELESLGISLQVEKPAEGFFEAELYALPPAVIGELNWIIAPLDHPLKPLSAIIGLDDVGAVRHQDGSGARQEVGVFLQISQRGSHGHNAEDGKIDLPGLARHAGQIVERLRLVFRLQVNRDGGARPPFFLHVFGLEDQPFIGDGVGNVHDAVEKLELVKIFARGRSGVYFCFVFLVGLAEILAGALLVGELGWLLEIAGHGDVHCSGASGGAQHHRQVHSAFERVAQNAGIGHQHVHIIEERGKHLAGFFQAGDDAEISVVGGKHDNPLRFSENLL
ncbi:MAG: SH3 domain-containing protein [Acidobacteria bacterium]|nr:SH3 domain-containing protein [Acidobacteriota bacterium]